MNNPDTVTSDPIKSFAYTREILNLALYCFNAMPPKGGLPYFVKIVMFCVDKIFDEWTSVAKDTEEIKKDNIQIERNKVLDFIYKEKWYLPMSEARKRRELKEIRKPRTGIVSIVTSWVILFPGLAVSSIFIYGTLIALPIYIVGCFVGGIVFAMVGLCAGAVEASWTALKSLGIVDSVAIPSISSFVKKGNTPYFEYFQPIRTNFLIAMLSLSNKNNKKNSEALHVYPNNTENWTSVAKNPIEFKKNKATFEKNCKLIKENETIITKKELEYERLLLDRVKYRAENEEFRKNPNDESDRVRTPEQVKESNLTHNYVERTMYNTITKVLEEKWLLEDKNTELRKQNKGLENPRKPHKSRRCCAKSI
jgi:hypothetical protein